MVVFHNTKFVWVVVCRVCYTVTLQGKFMKLILNTLMEHIYFFEFLLTMFKGCAFTLRVEVKNAYSSCLVIIIIISCVNFIWLSLKNFHVFPHNVQMCNELRVLVLKAENILIWAAH